MLVAFSDASRTPVSEAQRASYRKVFEHALDLMRPDGERWAVTLAESASLVRLDFARGIDAARSLTVAVDGDDQHFWLYQSVCTFLWTYWPKDVIERS